MAQGYRIINLKYNVSVFLESGWVFLESTWVPKGSIRDPYGAHVDPMGSIMDPIWMPSESTREMAGRQLAGQNI